MSAQDSLAEWLESLDADRYRKLLSDRADAVRLWRLKHPAAGEPVGGPDPVDLAGPLLETSSVIAAVGRLTTSQTQVLEAV